MPALLTKTDTELIVDIGGCRGSEFGDALTKIKATPGSRYDGKTKKWKLPAEALIAQRLIHSLQPVVSDELRDWVRQGVVKEQQELTTPLPEDAELTVPWAKERAPWQPEHIEIGDEKIPFTGLMRHQRPMVNLAATENKLIVADDMGLGKTGSMISAVAEWCLREGVDINSKPKLIVCPNSVKASWSREIKLWLGEDAPQAIIDGTTPAARRKQLSAALDAKAWIIVNWEQLRTTKVEKITKHRNGGQSKKKIEVLKEPLFGDTEWLAVVADECHRAKNRKALVTRGLWRCRGDLMFAASGTPIMNSPDELWAILHWLWPDEYTSYWSFYEKYVEYTEGYFGKEITGVKNPDALRFELRDRLARRTQGEVLDLPGKVRIPVPIKLNKSQRKLYDEAVASMWLEIEQAVKDGDKTAEKFVQDAAEGASFYDLLKLPNGAARTVRLRQIMETPALLGAEDDSAVMDTIVDHVLDSRPEPWIVFFEFAASPGILCERLRKHGLECREYTGSVDPKDRAQIERDFQSGSVDVVAGTIKSMYQGITLTNGNKQFWGSRDWVSEINEQGEDRQNRIGQSSRVSVFIGLPEDTVATSKIEPLNRLKEKIVRSVVVKDEIHQGDKT